jgi:prevent-host-death family protein
VATKAKGVESGAINMHEAKSRLSQLVEAVESGRETEIIIARNGKPAARLVPLAAEKPRRKLGQAAGKFNFDYAAFQALDAEVQRLFEESADPYGEKLGR